MLLVANGSAVYSDTIIEMQLDSIAVLDNYKCASRCAAVIEWHVVRTTNRMLGGFDLYILCLYLSFCTVRGQLNRKSFIYKQYGLNGRDSDFATHIVTAAAWLLGEADAYALPPPPTARPLG